MGIQLNTFEFNGARPWLGYRKNKAIAQVDFQKSETKKISSCSPNSSPAEISEK